MSKLRCVFDTNVITSAFLFACSKPAIALNYALRNGEILLSLELLEEISEVISREKFKKYITYEEREEFLETFLARVTLIKVIDLVRECRDPKDNKILELALSGKADYIVTGDQDLLVMNPFRQIKILSVAQFLRNDEI